MILERSKKGERGVSQNKTQKTVFWIYKSVDPRELHSQKGEGKGHRALKGRGT